MNDYEKQATDFLEKIGATMTVKFLRYDKHFEEDKEKRNVYSITFERKGKRSLSIPAFGQSIVASHKFYVNTVRHGKVYLNERFYPGYRIDEIKPNNQFGEPTAYDILACLTKYDPGKFEDFCDEFGYSEDSRKAYGTYEAVRDEWMDISRFFNADELTELQNIQ